MDRRPSKIFVSYRREDSGGHVLALLPSLRDRFGDRIFKDTDSIYPGQDFVAAIQRELESCAVLLAVIGKDWLTIQDAHGSRRLDNAKDYLRLEIATALRTEGMLVIPVLVGGSMMPVPEDLPADLAALAFRNGTELRDARWEADVVGLVTAIEAAIDQGGEWPGRKRERALLPAAQQTAALAAVALVVLCAIRGVAPLSGPGDLAAAVSTVALSLIAWLVLAGAVRLPRVLGRALAGPIARVPGVPAAGALAAVPIVAALGFLFHLLRPVVVTVERTQAFDPCQSIYVTQPYRSGGDRSQSALLHADGSDPCKVAFANIYQRVRIRTGIWPYAATGTLVLNAEDGRIDSVLVPRAYGAAVKPQGYADDDVPPAPSDITIRFAAPLDETAATFVCWFTVESWQARVRVTVELNANERRVGFDGAWAPIR